MVHHTDAVGAVRGYHGSAPAVSLYYVEALRILHAYLARSAVKRYLMQHAASHDYLCGARGMRVRGTSHKKPGRHHKRAGAGYKEAPFYVL